MPKYLIERELPGAGKLSPAEYTNIHQSSSRGSELANTVAVCCLR